MMTYAIIIANFVVFIPSLIFSNEIINELAFKPVYLSFERLPQIYTLFTSMFLHSTVDPFHIIFNTIMFVLIAPSFENRIGAKKFLLIYLTTGVFAAISHALLAPIIPSLTHIPFNPYIGLIGASGAISGILGAYTFAFPKDKVYFPVYIIIKMSVLYAGLIFLSIQTFYLFLGADPHIAYLAHIGGFISGIIIAALLIRNKKVESDTSTVTVSYDSYTPQKPGKINFSSLRGLATTPELREILNRIENETVPQVRDIWLEHFIEKTKCPKCGKTLNHFNKDIWCENCGFKTRY